PVESPRQASLGHPAEEQGQGGEAGEQRHAHHGTTSSDPGGRPARRERAVRNPAMPTTVDDRPAAGWSAPGRAVDGASAATPASSPGTESPVAAGWARSGGVRPGAGAPVTHTSPPSAAT